MIKAPSPTITVNCEREFSKYLQITADDNNLLLAFLTDTYQVDTAELIEYSDEPSLRYIVKRTFVGDIWELDMILALVAEWEQIVVEPEWAYKPWQPPAYVDFHNPTSFKAAG